jgi:hypothetical protein
MQHTIFGLIALYISATVLWIIKEVKEASNFGLLSDWSW